MSLSYKPLTPIVLLDPILNVEDVRAAAVIQGPSILNAQSYTTNSISSNNISWAVVPPQGVVVDRRFRVQVPIRLTFTGAIVASNAGYVPNSTLLNAGYDAPRQYPLMTMINTISCQLNNDTVTSTVGDAFAGLVKYNTTRDIQNRESSTTAAYPDQSANYIDLIGTARNPLGNYGNSSADIQRGAFPFKVVTNGVVVPATGAGTAATAIVDMVVTEDLMISPMYFNGHASKDHQGFVGLNNINLALNFFQGLGGKFFSHCPGSIHTSGADTVMSNVTNIAIQFNNFSGPAFSFSEAQPTLQMKYLTPNLLQRPMPSIQDTYTYQYYDQNMQPTDISAVPYSATGVTQVNMNSVTLPQIPTAVYLFVKPRSQILQNRCDLTDTFLNIHNVNITFGNQSSILSTFSQVQLFDIAIKNGYVGTWEQFSGLPLQNGAFLGTTGTAQFCGGGAPLKLMFGEDIYLPSSDCSGMANGNYQFNCSMQISNRNASGAWDAVPLSIYAVFVTAGSLTISNSNVSHQVAIISASDVLNAAEQPNLSLMNYRSDPSVIGGGDWMESLGNFGSKVNNFLKDSKIISTVGSLIPHPLAQTIATGARAVGYGMDECGGYSIGGKAMNKKQLKSLMYR